MKLTRRRIVAGGAAILIIAALASQPSRRAGAPTPAQQSPERPTIGITIQPTRTSTPTHTPRPTSTEKPTSTPSPTPIPIQPTVQPTATSASVVTPINTLAPTQSPAPTGIELVTLTSPVSIGSDATLQIRTAPGANCSLTYITPSGNVSEAQGLGATTTSDEGICSWTWKIGTRTNPGTGTLRVTANGVTQTYSIVIQ